jgi:hypothetical protein
MISMKKLYKFPMVGMLILFMISSSSSSIFSQNLKTGITDTTLTIGSSTKSCNYPFTTFWSSGRTQMLYTADEILSAGGFPGVIKKIGFDVHTYDSIPMNDFNISMRNISANTLLVWVTDSLISCYSGTYEVRGTGWQMILLRDLFNYDGRNLLVEICYTNTESSNFSPVSGTDMPQQILTYYADGMPGCSMSTTFQVTARPDIRIIEIPSLGIPADEIPESFSVYPNPADRIINLKSDNPLDEVSVINMAGQIVLRAKDNLQVPLEINTAGFPDGFYFIKAVTAKGVETTKICIQH